MFALPCLYLVPASFAGNEFALVGGTRAGIEGKQLILNGTDSTRRASPHPSASRWSKWMSAMTGIGDPARIFPNAAAAFASGTATRAISHPSLASDRICATVARTSRVSVFVMLWTETGAPPPTGTPPARRRGGVFMFSSLGEVCICEGG